MRNFSQGDRVTITTTEDDRQVTLHGTVSRGNWGRSGSYVTVRTDDNRTFVRDARQVEGTEGK
jgi:hypothetical protein